MTYLLDLVATEGVLEDLEVGDELILVLRVHLDAVHRKIACSRKQRAVAVTKSLVSGRGGED